MIKRVILILSLFVSFGFSSGEVTKIYAHYENATSSSFSANGSTYYWGQDKNLVIDGFEYGGHRYNYVSESADVRIRRSDNSYTSGNPCGLFAEKNGNAYHLKPTFPQDCDMAKVMRGRVINVGALDLFKNTGYTAKNIERVDFISQNGITAPSNSADLTKAGHVVTEKSGNNEIKIAAILSIDSNGNPTSFGPLVDIHGSGSKDYGLATIYLPDGSSIYKQYFGFYANEKHSPQGKPWYLTYSHEPLGMCFVTLQDLGISAGQKYYGFSYFGRDVTDSMNLVNYNSFPKNTGGDTADPYGGVASYFADETLIAKDYGDAPDSGTKYNYSKYHSSTWKNAERVTNGVYLGSEVTKEQTGHFSTNADGDSDDAITDSSKLVIDKDASTYSVTIHVSNQGSGTYTHPVSGATQNLDHWRYISAWIDWDNNGIYDNDEMIQGDFISLNKQFNGNKTLTWNIPSGLHSGDKRYMRIRLTECAYGNKNSSETISYNNCSEADNGYASFGEIEDYVVSVADDDPSAGTCSQAPSDLLVFNEDFDFDKNSDVSGNGGVGTVARYKNIATYNGQSLDLLVKVDSLTGTNSLYTGSSTPKGFKFQKINSKDPSVGFFIDQKSSDPDGTVYEAKLKISFVKHNTNQKVSVDFETQIFDFDNFSNRTEKVLINKNEYKFFQFSSNTHMAVHRNGDIDTFMNSHDEDSQNFNKNAMVKLVHENTDSYTIRFQHIKNKTSGHYGGKAGFNLVFGKTDTGLESCQNTSTSGVCYAISDVQNKLYKVYMNPGASPLPVATKIDITGASYDIDGEGGAYNSDDGMIYGFHESYSGPKLYRIDPNSGSATYITKFSSMKTNVTGASFYGGYFYVIAKSGDYNAKLYKISTSDWSIKSSTTLNGATTDADALAINKNGDAYIITDNDKKIYKININTAKTTFQVQISTNTDAEALSFAKDGNLYVENSEDGTSSDTDKLFKVNLQTGALTESAQIPHNDDIDIEGLSCNVVVPNKAQISGYVFNDKNHNMTKDSGENGLTKDTYIKLCQNGNFIKSTKVAKDTNGSYTFSDLAFGDYTILEDASNTHDCSTKQAPTGWILTTSNSIDVSLSQDEANKNFGNFNGSKISGKVFKDTDGDGHLDSGENGISNVNLVIKRCGNIQFDSTTTDSNGDYTFWVPVGVQGDNSVDGWIGVFETDPSGYISTGDEFDNGNGNQNEHGGAQSDDNWLCFSNRGVDFDNGGYVLTGNNFGDATNSSLIAEYRFDECSWDGTDGEVKDSSGNGFNGKAYNGATTFDDSKIINRSGKFIKSQDQYVKVTNMSNFNKEHFTVSLWVKMHENVSGWQTLLQKGNSSHKANGVIRIKYKYRGSKSDKLGIYTTLSSGSSKSFYKSGVGLKDNKWHHLVVTYSNKNFKVYLDKTLIKQKSYSKGLADPDQELYIGGKSYKSNAYLDEIKLYSSALTQNDINNIYNNEKAGKNHDGSTREAVNCSGKPFTCSQEAYLFTGTSTSDAYTLNLSDGNYSLVKNSIQNRINATGYNVKDDFIWGYDINAHKVIKIDADYKVTSYKLSSLPDKNYYAGDVDKNGILYLKTHDDDKIYKVNLNSGTPVYDNYISLTISGQNFGDFAFNPVDDKLYGISEKDANLYRIDSSNGNMTNLGNTGLSVSDIKFHTFVFDKSGNLYFYGEEGKIYKIDLGSNSSAPYTATVFATTDIKKSGGDGARCPNADVPQHSEDICYAIDPYSDYLYTTYVNPGASSLPQATKKHLDYSNVPSKYSDSLDGQSQAYNPKDGLIYRFREEDMYFYSIDPETAKVTYIKTFSGLKEWIVGASFYGDYLYLIAKHYDESTLYKIETTNWTIVSQVDVKDNSGNFIDVDSLAINSDGDAYITDFRENKTVKHLFSLNLKTGKVTQLYNLSNPIDLEGLSFAKDDKLFISNSAMGTTQDDNIISMLDLSDGSRTSAAHVPESFDAHINGLSCNIIAKTPQTCEGAFPGVLNSTEKVITLTGAVTISNNHQALITKKLTATSALCDGKPCKKSNTLASLYDVSVNLGSGKDGQGFGKGTITSSKEYTSASVMGNVKIKGDVIIKIQGTLNASGMASLKIEDGDVKIYANNVNMMGMTNINIKNGSLTIIANNMTFSGTLTNSGDRHVVLLSKNNITFGAGGVTKILAYAGNNMTITGALTVNGALTGNKITIGAGAILKYNTQAVNNFCNPPETVHLSTSAVATTEGDSGTKSISLTVTADKTVTKDGGVSVSYSLEDGTAKAGEDYSTANGSVTIPKGSSSATITLNVIKGDTLVEKDEYFYVNLSSSDSSVRFDNDKVKVTIQNDDVKFLMVETNGDKDHTDIQTKIVNKSFNIKVLSVDENKSLEQNTLFEDTSIRIIPSSSDCSNPNCAGLTGWKQIDIFNKTGKTVSLLSSKANKDVKIQMKWKNNTRAECSIDNFAIRPDKFQLTLPTSTVKAGENFTFKIKALDHSSNPTTDYNEQKDVSFTITPKEQKASSCATGTLTFGSTVKFTNGNFNDNHHTTYNNIGVVDINISEKLGNEFAKVDAKDTDKEYRLITSDEKTMTFIPAKFGISATLSDAITNLTFYGDSSDVSTMGASLATTVTALPYSGSTPLSNYTDGCYSDDTNLTVTFTNSNTSDTHTIVSDQNIVSQSSSQFVLDVNKSSFTNGSTNKNIKLNLDRNNTLVKNPSLFTITKIVANDSTTSSNIALSSSNKAHFYYGRAHAPSPQTSTTQSFDAKVYYEIYCKGSTCGSFSYANGQASIDEVYWYILSSAPSVCNYNSPTAINHTTVSKTDKYNINLTAPSMPYADKIYYKPSVSYLRYNKFGFVSPHLDEHSFDVKFTTANTVWAGKGSTGYTVDTNTSKKSNQSLDW